MFKIILKNSKDEAVREHIEALRENAERWVSERTLVDEKTGLASYPAFQGATSFEIIDVTDEESQKQINAESKAYLDSTDWYIVRKMDTGIAVPDDIESARQAAREAVK